MNLLIRQNKTKSTKKIIASILLFVMVATPVAPISFLPNNAYALGYHPLKDTPEQSTKQSTQEEEEEEPEPPELRGCTLIPGFFKLEKCLASIGAIGLWLVSFGTMLAGKALDKSIDLSINGMKNYVQEGNSIVSIGWSILRDLANIIFIFLILWIAIQTVLGIGSGDPTSAIARIIIVGLLINFSLFIGKAVIDASNVLALQFYNALGSGGSLSSIFAQGLAISTIYNPDGMQDLSALRIILTTVVGMIFLIIAAWIFLALAVLFLVRTIVLVILLTLAPLAFVSWIVPGLQGKMSEWWNKLLKNAFFAPLSLVMLYVVGRSVLSLGGIGGEKTTMAKMFEAADSGKINESMASSIGNLVINFVFIIIMLLTSATVAYSMSSYGASTVQGWGRSLKKWTTNKLSAGGRSALNAGGSMVNKGVGLMGRKVGEMEAVKRWGDKPGGLGRVLGGAIARTAERAQKARVFGLGRSYEEARQKGSVFRAGEEEIKGKMKEKSKNPEEMLNYFMQLDERQQRMAFKNLSLRERALLSQQAKTQQEKDAIQNQVKGLSREEQQNLEDEILRLERRNAQIERESIAKAVAQAIQANPSALQGNAPLTININGVGRSIAPDEAFKMIQNLSVDNLADMDKETLESLVRATDARGRTAINDETFFRLMNKSNVAQDVLESLKKARFQNLENLVKKANKSQAEEAELERIISQIGKKEAQFIDRAILQHTDFVKNMNTSIIQGLIKAEEFDALDDIEKEMEKIIATPGSNVKASMGRAYDLYQTFKKKL